jgi:hypothetical protein
VLTPVAAELRRYRPAAGLLAGLLQVALFPPLSLGIRFPGNIPSYPFGPNLGCLGVVFSGHVT